MHCNHLTCLGKVLPTKSTCLLGLCAPKLLSGWVILVKTSKGCAVVGTSVSPIGSSCSSCCIQMLNQANNKTPCLRLDVQV